MILQTTGREYRHPEIRPAHHAGTCVIDWLILHNAHGPSEEYAKSTCHHGKVWSVGPEQPCSECINGRCLPITDPERNAATVRAKLRHLPRALRSSALREHTMSLSEKIITLIDEGLATAPTFEPAYGPTGSNQTDDICWRCTHKPTDGPAGLCAECRTIMLDEDYVADERYDAAFALGETGPVASFQGITYRPAPQTGRATMHVPAGNWTAEIDGLHSEDDYARILPWPDGHCHDHGDGHYTVHNIDFRSETVAQNWQRGLAHRAVNQGDLSVPRWARRGHDTIERNRSQWTPAHLQPQRRNR